MRGDVAPVALPPAHTHVHAGALTNTHSTHPLTDPHRRLARTGRSRDTDTSPRTHSTQRHTRAAMSRTRPHACAHTRTHTHLPPCGHSGSHTAVSTDPHRHTDTGEPAAASASTHTCATHTHRYTHANNVCVCKRAHTSTQSQSHCPWLRGPPLPLGTIGAEVAGPGQVSTHLNKHPRVGSGGSGTQGQGEATAQVQKLSRSLSCTRSS